MILVYRVFTTLLYPFLHILIYFRKILKKEDYKRYKEKILISHFNVKKETKSKLIWFHAASIGEFKSIIPIISQLNKNFKNLKFLITTTTLSSGNIAKIELRKFKNVEHRYFPYDVDFLIDNFLYLWKPDKIFLVDSEIWPNLIFKAKKYKISIALINARLTTKTFYRWMMIPNTARKIFGIFDLCLCSNSETKKFLEKLNAKNIYYKGNIKLIDQRNNEKIKDTNKNFLFGRRFWLAASTHEGEDILCLNTHLKIKEKFKNIITIIAPRHIERSKKIKSLFEKFNLQVQLLEKNESILKNSEIIIINYFGGMDYYFRLAKSVFIGKSMIRDLSNEGGQNPLEAAKLNCKIYHGKYVNNFKNIYQLLKKIHISHEVKNQRELSRNLVNDLENPVKKGSLTSHKIKKIGKKTFKDTMIIVNKFLKNDYQ